MQETRIPLTVLFSKQDYASLIAECISQGKPEDEWVHDLVVHNITREK